jgi:hypothetical protein
MPVPFRRREKGIGGTTVMEVIVAIFIFSCISAVVFNLLGQTERIRSRAIFVENATRLAAGEAERLRSHATGNVPVDDSDYTETVSGRTFRIERKHIDNDRQPSFLARGREPAEIELRISDERNNRIRPLRFKLLVGQDNP